jgi:hypothetical protein
MAAARGHKCFTSTLVDVSKPPRGSHLLDAVLGPEEVCFSDCGSDALDKLLLAHPMGLLQCHVCMWVVSFAAFNHAIAPYSEALVFGGTPKAQGIQALEQMAECLLKLMSKATAL